MAWVLSGWSRELTQHSLSDLGSRLHLLNLSRECYGFQTSPSRHQFDIWHLHILLHHFDWTMPASVSVSANGADTRLIHLVISRFSVLASMRRSTTSFPRATPQPRYNHHASDSITNLNAHINLDGTSINSVPREGTDRRMIVMSTLLRPAGRQCWRCDNWTSSLLRYHKTNFNSTNHGTRTSFWHLVIFTFSWETTFIFKTVESVKKSKSQKHGSSSCANYSGKCWTWFVLAQLLLHSQVIYTNNLLDRKCTDNILVHQVPLSPNFLQHNLSLSSSTTHPTLNAPPPSSPHWKPSVHLLTKNSSLSKATPVPVQMSSTLSSPPSLLLAV